MSKKSSHSNSHRFNTTLSDIQSSIPNNSATFHIGWRLLLTILILLSLIAFGLWSSPNLSAKEMRQQDGEPLVFAFYYTWFDESTWYSNTLSDQPRQPYASRDRAIMGQHIEQAQRAGIDAFMVAWYGPGPNQTEPNLAALLEEAALRNFKIGILFESDAPTFNGIGDVSAALQHARTVHMQHPAYVRVGGRPVMFFWRPYIYNVGTWTSVRNQVDPSGSQIWISEGVDVSFLSTFDGHHLYSNTWKPASDLGYTNQKFARWVQNAREQHGKRLYWVSTVMPGYDDVRIRPTSGYRKGREGGAYYERGWQAAIDSKPDWIVVNSFNEWPEGTYIEPSMTYGDTFLNLTAVWSQRYTGRAPRTYAPSVSAPAFPNPAPKPSPTTPVVLETFAEERVAVVDVDLLNVRSQPNTSSNIVAQLSQQMSVQALARSGEWIQVSTPQVTGWVYAPMIRLQSPNTVQSSTTVQGSTTVQSLAQTPISPTIERATVPTAQTSSSTAGRLVDQPIAIVNVPSLNLRREPSTKSEVVRLLIEDLRLPITDIGLNDIALDELLADSSDFDVDALNDATWLQVIHDGVSGWIYSPMVRIDGTLSTISN